MGEVLSDVNLLCSFTSTDEIVTTLDARGGVFVYQGRLLLFEPKTGQQSPTVQDLTAS